MMKQLPFHFGVDYYPEHWPEERWAQDARMMREFGLEIVRLAEFSWFKMEPREGEFHFDWLDRAIDTLHGEGLQVILGTPTAAPPAWIIQDDPEIQPVDSLGLVHGFGGRHHDCQSNPHYRQHIRRFVTAFVQHFKDNPAVIGWQVDNELGNSHGDLCHCRHCERRFQQWLEAKYGDIDTLNRRWGTAFWSQGYQSFSQIPTPRMTASGHNPSHVLDWRRFCSDLVLEFHEFQAQIIRDAAPHAFITHNCMGFSDKVSYFDLGDRLDFMAHDQYPGGHFLPRHCQNVVRDADLASELDFIRSVKKQPFMIMEQQSSITGWETLGHAPKPGQLALWSMQAVAHGADAVVYFRWRSCLMGTEQYWHGLLPHSGIPGRNYRELEAFVHQVKPLMPRLCGAMPPREAAIAFSYEEEWALSIQPHHPDLRYVDHLMTYYRALHHQQVPTDFVRFEEDWSGYKMLIVPLYFLTSPEINAKLTAYATSGGTLVLDMRAGVKDMDNLCLADAPLPVGLTALTGVVVDEYDCLVNGENSVLWGGERYPVRRWCDVMHLEGAEALAVFAQEFYQGQPAITRNRVGQGWVYYVGTEMSDELSERLVRELRETSGAQSLGQPPQGVELTCREKDGVSYLFALNHLDQPQPLTLEPDWKPLLGSQEMDTQGTLPPYGYAVYQRQRGEAQG